MENENNRDRSLDIKRAVVWVLSFAIGTALSLAMVYLALGSNLGTYSIKYFVLTVIFLSMVFVIWGDLLLGAKILPD